MKKTSTSFVSGLKDKLATEAPMIICWSNLTKSNRIDYMN